MVRFVHLVISEKGFDHVLTVIKSAFDGEIMDVRIQNRGHLHLLNSRDFAITERNEDADILFATQAVDCGAACVIAGSANDCEMLARLAW